MNTKFYRVYDLQRGVHFATGYNSTSEKELLECFESYVNMSGDGENVTFYHIGEMHDHLQGIDIEESNTPFEEYDY